ncbi:MAG: site-2 protease family protein, partial [Methylococcaceae bacterium]|nr:site-2 protease family protein [Methylococcaceae bacterium]
ILSGVLPDYWAWQFNRIERFGFVILLILLSTNALGMILQYPMFYTQQWFFSLAGL